MKKGLKIAVVIIATLAIGVGGYFLFRYLTSPTDQQSAIVIPSNQSDSSSSEAAKALTNDSIFDFWTNPKTEEVYYMANDGRISRITPEGAIQPLTPQTIPGLNRVVPADDGSSALIAFGYPRTPSFSIFNVAKRSFQPLPQGTTGADWSPNSNNVIVYLQNNGASGRLSTLNLTTGKSTELLRINQKDLSLDWVFPETIYLYEKPSEKTLNSFWSYDIKSKSIKKLAEEQNLMIKWWPEKSLGLKLSGNKLTLINPNNTPISSAGIATLPSKCWLGEPFIYCGAQASLRQNSSAASLLKQSGAREIIFAINSLTAESSQNLSGVPAFVNETANIELKIERIEKQTDRLLLLNGSDHKLYSLPL